MAKNKTLFTLKNDPNNLAANYNSYRTIWYHKLANNLEIFIRRGSSTVLKFENTKVPNSPLYSETTPNQNSGFNVPASGVTATSIFTTSGVDKIAAVSGQTQGWHFFAEDSSVIQTKENNGDLIFKNNL